MGRGLTAVWAVGTDPQGKSHAAGLREGLAVQLWSGPVDREGPHQICTEQGKGSGLLEPVMPHLLHPHFRVLTLQGGG
jgi:hypothetical protein